MHTHTWMYSKTVEPTDGFPYYMHWYDCSCKATYVATDVFEEGQCPHDRLAPDIDPYADEGGLMCMRCLRPATEKGESRYDVPA